MLCTEKSAVKHDGGPITVHPLRCKCWHCSHCAPIKRRDLRFKARRGEPRRFLTLTVRKGLFPTPEAQARAMVDAWYAFRRYMVRKHKIKPPPYLYTIEQHKSGWPHMHLLLRGDYIDQRVLVKWWKARFNSHRVDIRHVKDARGAAAYVSKYLAKDPVRFGTMRRWNCSRDWELTKRPDKPSTGDDRTWWERVDSSPMNIARMALQDGARVTFKGSLVVIEGWLEPERRRWGIG